MARKRVVYNQNKRYAKGAFGHQFSAIILVVDLTPADSKFACLRNCIGYIGVASTDSHAKLLA